MQYMTLEQKQQFAKDLRQLADILDTDAAVNQASADWTTVDDGLEEIRMEEFGHLTTQKIRARPMLVKFNFDITFMPMTKEWRRPEDQPKPKPQPKPKAKKRKKRKGRK